MSAAVGVVLYHLGVYAKQNFGVQGSLIDVLTGPVFATVPVPLFFALSGFVLTHALHGNPDRGRFLVARFLRLYPGYWIAAGVVAAVMAAIEWPISLPFVTRLTLLGWTLRPHEYGECLYVLGVEWSLVYEVFLSIALAGLSLFGIRRALPFLMVVWLAAICAKTAFWPHLASEPLPNWQSIGLSAFNVPFLLGVLAYYLRAHGHSLRWPAAVGTVTLVAALQRREMTLDELWLLYGTASAALVWWSVQVRQVRAERAVVRAGDWTYGLYLMHVPIILGTFALLDLGGLLVGTLGGVAITGTAALVGGFLYGRVEAAVHARLRPLAKAKLPAWTRRIRLPFRAGRLPMTGRRG